MMAKTSLKRTAPRRKAPSPAQPLDPQLLQRVVVEHIHPEVDGGRFPIKRTIDETVVVSADVFADGHDMVAAALLHRRHGEPDWTEVPMTPAGNDRWTAAFTVNALGRYEYTVEGWIDRFGTWRHELSKKFGAGQDVTSELREGMMLVEGAGTYAGGAGAIAGGAGAIAESARFITDSAGAIGDTSIPAEQRVALALDADLQQVMAARADRSRATRHERVLTVVVEPVRARYGAWYEMFPRSAGTDPTRSATFEE